MSLFIVYEVKILNLSYSTLQKLMTKCRDLGIIETIKGGGYKIMLEHFDIGNTDYFQKARNLFIRRYTTPFQPIANLRVLTHLLIKGNTLAK